MPNKEEDFHPNNRKRRTRGTHKILEVLIKGFRTRIVIGANNRIRNWAFIRPQLERESDRIINGNRGVEKQVLNQSSQEERRPEVNTSNVDDEFTLDGPLDDPDDFDAFASIFEDFPDVSEKCQDSPPNP
jgi:hypothetical protein